MYFIYSFLTLVAFLIVSPYFLYQAMRYKKYVGSLRQRLGYLPITLNVDGDESIWIHAVSVGEALTARALIADLQDALPAAASVSVDDDDRRAAGRPEEPAAGRRHLLLSVRLGLHRAPHARHREAAPVRDDGNRDLAEPAAPLPRARA